MALSQGESISASTPMKCPTTGWETLGFFIITLQTNSPHNLTPHKQCHYHIYNKRNLLFDMIIAMLKIYLCLHPPFNRHKHPYKCQENIYKLTLRSQQCALLVILGVECIQFASSSCPAYATVTINA